MFLTSGPAWITDNAIYARQIDSAVLPEFACLVLKSENLNALAGGSGQPYVSQALLNGVAFRLPQVEEQTLVVDVIKERFARIGEVEAQAMRAHELFDRLDGSILSKAFRGELATDDPLSQQTIESVA